jgi:RHS repeat-associated protein
MTASTACASNTPFSPPQRFTGKERDAESGNDYFFACYYSSAMGRFLSPDWSSKIEPVPYSKLDDPQTLNLYAYLRNNPLGGVDADGHCGAGPNDPPCTSLKDNPATHVSPAVKQAIKNSVNASNHPTADDKKGKSHEEGGNAWTANGKQTVSPSQPGPYKDVKTPGEAHVDPYRAADPSTQKPNDIQADVEWHVHPAASITETTSANDNSGQFTLGGQVTQQTFTFNQPPSSGPNQDIELASPAPTLNIVVGARDSTAYFYTGAGVTCTESLKEFYKP